MMKTARATLLLSIIFAIFGIQIYAQEIVLVDAANPPFMYASSGTSPAGLYPQIIMEAFKRMGTPINVQALPWRRVLTDVDSGKAGVAGIYQNPERLQKYDYSNSFYEERIGVYVARGKEKQFTRASDLVGKTVGVLNGWSYNDDFDTLVKSGKIKVEAVPDDLSNFRKLSLGRLDAVLSIVESGSSAIQTIGANSTISLSNNLLVVNKVYLAFAKSAKKSTILSRFNNAITQMQAEGTFDRIVLQAFK